MPSTQLPTMFLTHAADVIGDTTAGLSGTQIVRLLAGYGVEYGVNIPHATYPNDAPNKRTSLLENLRAFDGHQQHRILRELCDYEGFKEVSPERQRIKIQLATTYREFDIRTGAEGISDTLIEDTRHWLDGCPAALTVYNEAIGKFRADVFQRNILDDLRLSLEILLKHVFQNQRSLENQLAALGTFILARGGSREFTNMFVKLVEYYSRYQNAYVKHDNAVVEEEIEFILEITSSFMRHIVRMSGKVPAN